MSKETHFEQPTRQHVAILAYDSVNDRWQAVYVDASGNLQVEAAALPLPTGAATEATLADCKTALELLDDLRNALDSVGTDELDVNIEASVALDSQAHGHIGGAWQKQPLVFGYSDAYSEYEYEDNVSAGTNDLTFSTVPSGEVWVITHWSAWANQSNPTHVYFRPQVAGTLMLAQMEDTVSAYKSLHFHGEIVLEPGDYLQVRFIGCALNDDIRAQANGYKMDIDL